MHRGGARRSCEIQVKKRKTTKRASKPRTERGHDAPVLERIAEQLERLDYEPPHRWLEKIENQIGIIRQEQSACFQTIAQILARLDRIMPLPDTSYVLLKVLQKKRSRRRR